eukprot:CAMPEP_0181237320 /NCGR_PEP_ID=MMETSP1096-20121128/38694_1 /TAXON_ID=156174 ORGANISM="Chrysochromulina ericina, Strain CCMP281" /NCGR_SAMPLE_ID=MMETSP1096 /ASSEMBLY_ACC=CAM_ASM_000453 /LENGTH=53 /DNA_ID=CAMNT_0023332655 /DNA_START=819 /DNA_END=976 /DNA_ORIENTATION=-
MRVCTAKPMRVQRSASDAAMVEALPRLSSSSMWIKSLSQASTLCAAASCSASG